MSLNQPPDIERHWRNRRRMAWGSFYALVAIGAGCFVAPGAANQTQAILGTLALAFATIIGAYIGFATLDDIKARQ